MAQFILDAPPGQEFTTAQPVSDIRPIMPFSQFGVNSVYVYEQDFVQLRANFTPLAIDTAHPTIPNCYLALETNPQAVGRNDIVRWTRRYASVPTSFSHSGGTYPYTFPVILTGVNASSRLAPFSFSVASRVQVDFFHQSDPSTVAVIEPQRYVISTSPQSDATSPFGQPVVSNAIAFVPTIPDQPTYSGWVTAGVEIVPEASKLTSYWMGYIHMRETIYIKAH